VIHLPVGLSGTRNAEPAAWAAVLKALSPGCPANEVTTFGSRAETDELVSEARHSYLRLTGRLE
jgi:hypothetical protein